MSVFEIAQFDYSKCHPTADKADNRDMRTLRMGVCSRVRDYWFKHGVASLAFLPVADTNRVIQQIIACFPENTPIADFMKSEENQEFFRNLAEALNATQIVAAELMAAVATENEPLRREILHLPDPVTDAPVVEELRPEQVFPKPSVPVLAMNRDQIQHYYPEFLKAAYSWEQFEHPKRQPRLYSTEAKAADGLHLFAEREQSILDRTTYQGRGTGGRGIGRKLSVLVASMMSRLDIDYNSFASEVPEGHRGVAIPWDDEELLNGFIQEKSQVTKKKTSKIDKIMAATKKRAGEADLASRNKNPRMEIDVSAIQPRQSSFSAPGPAAGSRSLVHVITVPAPTASPPAQASYRPAIGLRTINRDGQPATASLIPGSPAQSFHLRLDETTGELNNTRDRARQEVSRLSSSFGSPTRIQEEQLLQEELRTDFPGMEDELAESGALAVVDHLDVDVAAVLSQPAADPVQDATVDTLPDGWTKNGTKYKCPTCKRSYSNYKSTHKGKGKNSGVCPAGKTFIE